MRNGRSSTTPNEGPTRVDQPLGTSPVPQFPQPPVPGLRRDPPTEYDPSENAETVLQPGPPQPDWVSRPRIVEWAPVQERHATAFPTPPRDDHGHSAPTCFGVYTASHSGAHHFLRTYQTRLAP